MTQADSAQPSSTARHPVRYEMMAILEGCRFEDAGPAGGSSGL